MSEYAIGIDLGGTKIIAGVVDIKTGKVMGHAKKRTKKEKGQDKIVRRIIETVEKAICIAQVPITEISSIGIGAAGQVDRDNGILIASHNLECFDVPLRDILSTHFRLPVFVGNDVEVATLGEKTFGSGKGYNDFVCIFVGTGIGSGIIKDGELHKGVSGTAGEIGHIIVDSGGRSCQCGSNGCLEAYASRSAIEKKIFSAIKKGHKTVMKDLIKEDAGQIRSKHIKEALERNDEIVINCITEASEYLSSGLASVINFYNPELIILGGGLINSVDFYYKISVKKAFAKALPTASNNVKITKASLGDFSGLVGASLLEKYSK